VDPGAHAVRVRAAGKKPFETNVDAHARATQAVTIAALADDPDAVRPVDVAPPPPPPAPPPRTLRTAGLIVGGIGAAALVTGAALGVWAKVRYDAVDGECPQDRCTPHGKSERNAAFDVAAAATFVAIGGAVVLGAGGGMILLAPSPGGATARVSW